VVDGNLITSRKPEDLPDFCRALLEALAAPVAEPAHLREPAAAKR
jgi:putative intracellular protease/amidase